MASLYSLRSDLSYWNNQTAEWNGRIRTLKRRRGDVESVRRALRSTADNNSSQVNDRIRRAAGRLENAIGYSGSSSLSDAIFAGKAEQTLGSDGELSSADGELSRELDEIDRKLGEANSNLSRAQGKIRETKAAIAAEERRQREEAARRAAQKAAEKQ